MKKGASNLGRGLAALLGDDIKNLRSTSDATSETTKEFAGALTGEGAQGFSKDSSEVARKGLATIAIGDLIPNPSQPRKVFDETTLDELSASIKKNGILQPLIVTPATKAEGHRIDGEADVIGVEGQNLTYIIVAGERRWRAAQRAGLHEVPAIVKDFDERQRSEIAIVENIQREDLSPLELAEAYVSLIERFNYKQEDLALTLGKNRSTIANSMRLLALPASVKDKLMRGALTEGHARLLVGLETAESMAEMFVKKSMTVREAERAIHKLKKSDNSHIKGEKTEKNPNILALEQEIEEILGLKTQVEHGKSTDEGGKITIFYRNAKQLDPFLYKIRGE